MICMGEVGMKRVLFKVILPLLVIAAWMNMCYWICIRADGFDFFLYWIMIGCPYGIRKMCMFIVPKNFGIAGNIGILALNCIIGGVIGGGIIIIKITNQNAKDQAILADKLGLSDKQLSYVTNSEPGSGLILFDNVVIPFVDKYPTDTKTYRIMNTKPEESV